MALQDVAEKIHRKDWPRVANKLGMFADDVEEIQKEYSNSSKQQVCASGSCQTKIWFEMIYCCNICKLVYLFIVFREHGRYIDNINHLW